jgi:simple sugar transport system ATP-binding protein
MTTPVDGLADPALDQERPLVELVGVGKSYGALRANDDISLAVHPGEIHVIVGENGAGKSTLMGVLSGAVQPDAGVVKINGTDVTGHDPRAAMEAGVGMVHQHFQLVGNFTVAENIALGFEPIGRFGLLDRNAARSSANRISQQFGLAVDGNAVVNDMSVGMQQRVEIVKILTRDAKILIFDEPTAVLTEAEAASLVQILKRLRDSGCAILFVTHKLREALALADTVSVLRRGKLVATLKPEDTDVSRLGELMVGRPLEAVQRVREPAAEAGEQAPVAYALEEAGVGAKTLHGVALRELSLQVRYGQLVSILGVDGNGQQEVMTLLTGAVAPDLGRVHLDGQDMTGRPTGDFLAAGLGIVPADRQHDGLVLSMPISRNLVLDRRHEDRFRTWRGLLIDEKAIERYAAEAIERFDIRAIGARQVAGSLSGGNQQKVVLARELGRDIKVLLAAHPTRGLDVGSIQFVHRSLIGLAEDGKAVLVVTSDLDEALAVSDAIAVLHQGAIVGTVTPPFDRSEIGRLMGGVAP